MHLTIRPELPADYRAVEELTRNAFWDVHVPGCDEQFLAHLLRDAPCFIPALDLVALADKLIVGNIMYTLAALIDTQGIKHQVISFGPLSVAPEYQSMGIGRALIERSVELARKLDYRAILIYGDPEYYCRFGFTAAEDFGICGRGGMFTPALQVLELIPGTLEGISGTFLEDEAYTLDPEAASQFELGFPKREKGFKPSQLHFQEMLKQAHF